MAYTTVIFYNYLGRPLKSVGVASPGWHLPRPKMSKRDMYEASKRAWSQLPEVKAKALAEKRKSQAETNRLRVKLYQKVNINITFNSVTMKICCLPIWWIGGAIKTEKTQQTETLNYCVDIIHRVFQEDTCHKNWDVIIFIHNILLLILFSASISFFFYITHHFDLASTASFLTSLLWSSKHELSCWMMFLW